MSEPSVSLPVTFKTNSGTCRVTEEELRFTHVGWRGWLARSFINRPYGSAVLAFGVLALIIGLCGVGLLYFYAQYVAGGLMVVVSIFVLWGVSRQAGHQYKDRIAINTVVAVKAQAPRPSKFIHRGFFIVIYREKGAYWKQMIVLKDGVTPYRKAREALRASPELAEKFPGGMAEAKKLGLR